MGVVRKAVVAACLVVMPSAWAAAQDASPLTDDASAPAADAGGPFTYDEAEVVAAVSPAGKVALELPAGTSVRDYEASPAGDETAVILEDATHKQRVAFWRFDGAGFARSVDVPAGTGLASLTWHPKGGAVFLLATAGQEPQQTSQILKLDAAARTFAPRQVFSSAKPLRRLVVGPRPFQVDGEGKAPSYRLFFGERLANGNYSLRSVSENGKGLYTVAGPQADAQYKNRDDAEAPQTAIVPSALPVAFHPAGNVLIWQDGKKCLNKLLYNDSNWDKPEPFGECGHTVTYTPNGIATIDWQPAHPGIRIHGLTDKTDAAALGEYTFEGIPSHMPDGRGVVAVAAAGGHKTLLYAPISVPLAGVANAWMYIEKPADLQKFEVAHGLLRPLPRSDQLYQLYDSESYRCGDPDVSTPTRPYYVTTDLFWELYGAAFDGLFIVLEREQAMPAFARFVAAADDQLAAHHPGSREAKAFAAARAVLEGHADRDPEARLIVAASGEAMSPALNIRVNYAEFKPRGHYTSDEQKRYFGAVRYLSQVPFPADSAAMLRGLDPAVGKAALDWTAVYQPFVASSRLALVWGDAPASVIASHPDKNVAAGTRRLFPLSWAWDNEALDNVVFHGDWPPAEQIATPAGVGRAAPSGLDFAAIAGNRLARSVLDRSGVLTSFPNLGPRQEAVRRRFQAAAGKSGKTLYDNWIAALATQWADAASIPVAGPLWDAKRLQTGLASWATLRHATVLVNDKTAAECGESGFEAIVLRPPRGYVEPDPQTFAAIAALFDDTIRVVQAIPSVARDRKVDGKLRAGIVRRLTESRDNTVKYQRIAEKELRGERLTTEDYQLIQYVGRAAEHNFLVFTSLSNPEYALTNPEPMMKVADVAEGPGGSLEAAVGRPLEWDQVVPFFGRSEIVKGSVYSYYEFASGELLDDAGWRQRVDAEKRPDWVTGYLSDTALSCPARQP